jgi:16S rRNA (adenine1518-N6/adenine1519-N6)-dimethyltransferase
MQIDDLPPLRDVITTHGLDAKKSLGQNFLLDLNLTSKIARLAGDISGHDVLEVGPGPGGLTRGLLAAGARRVVALEKDPRCMAALSEISAAYPGRLDVFNADALDFDMRGQLTGPVRVVANLPYNVGTELLVRWLTPKDWPPFWSSLTLMFQKEVAERIIAKPGTKAYGRLGILAQWKVPPQWSWNCRPKPLRRRRKSILPWSIWKPWHSHAFQHQRGFYHQPLQWRSINAAKCSAQA